MDQAIDQMKEFHWLMDMIQTIEVGLVVLDADFNVRVWNSFMESHSGIDALNLRDENIFEHFPDLPETWLRHKVNTVFTLKTRSFMTWEQRPYLFRFRNDRPITGTESVMFQNITISPLVSVDGSVSHVVIMVYDVTSIATNRKALEHANDELAVLSRTDSLTQLNNRGHWEERLVEEFSRIKRYCETSSVVMFDIDHFKNVNDTYGHPAGDEVIRTVSGLLRESLRESDVAGRYGGEEFGIILTNTDAEAAFVFCERLRGRIEASCVLHEGREINITVSFGVSEFKHDTEDHQAWIEQADQALYAAKESGRNQTWVHAKV